MKTRNIILIAIIIATVAIVKKVNARDNEMLPDYLPGIEASFEVLHPVGHVNQFESEMESDLQLEAWMSCDSIWNVSR